jgi:hypothetical protein
MNVIPKKGGTQRMLCVSPFSALQFKTVKKRNKYEKDTRRNNAHDFNQRFFPL